MTDTSHIISFLAALLTGGFLMLFIESQKLSASVTDRFQRIMKPFYHKLSNYLRVAYYFNRSMKIDNRDDDDRIAVLKHDLDKFSKICSESDLPTGYYSEVRLFDTCNRINNVWLYINNSYLRQFFTLDSHCISMVEDRLRVYVAEVSHKYDNTSLDLESFAQISGEFYSEIFIPVEGITRDYEKWQREERNYRILSIGALMVTLVSMLLIILIPYLCHWFVMALTLISSGLLIWEVIALIRLYRLANTVCRA